MKIQLTIFRTPTDSFPWNYSGHKFEVGRNLECALPITGELSHLVSWRHAEIELLATEAVVRDLGSTNGTYVNGRRIQAATRLRPGDEVWLGDGGPRLRVSAIEPEASQRSESTTSAGAAPTAPLDPTVQLLVEMNRSQRQTTLIIASIVGLVLLLMAAGGGLAWWAMRTTPSMVIVQSPSGANAPSSPIVSGNAPPKNDVQRSEPKPPDELPKEAPHKPIEPPGIKPPQDPWQAVQQNLAESVYLIVVEEPKSNVVWGAANATAVSDTRLVTSGLMGIELANFQKNGWNIYALRNTLNERTQIATILVQSETESEDHQKQIFFDYSLLVATQPLPGKPAQLASAAEIASLEPGLPLASVAIEYGVDPLNRLQSLKPQLLANRIFAISQLADEPGAPQMARIRGTFVTKPIGCPIVNSAGHVVGIYADEEETPLNAEQLKNHYMPVLTPEFIELGVTGKPNPLWVTPKIPGNPLPQRK